MIADYTRKLAAIVVADVVDYSRLMSADEEATHARLSAHRRDLLEPAIARHRGRLVKMNGDGFLLDFASVVDAVKFALAANAGVEEREADRPVHERIRLRFGVNLGDVIVDGEDIFGAGVNVAARLESLAEPGAIYVTQEVRDQVWDKIPAMFEEVGRIVVKNIDRPIHVFRIQPKAEDGVASAGSATDDRFETAAKDFDLRPAIAVLPFENLTGDADQEYVSDGLTDDIVVGLSHWRWFPVIASSSTRIYKGRSLSVTRVGLELGASYVLQGSVRKGAGRVRITCQLLEVAHGRAIWAEQYDRTLDDLLAVQQEIASSIVSAIEPELDRAEYRRSAEKPVERLDSWTLVRRANFHMSKMTREDAEVARRLYEQALAIEPNSVEALTHLGWWHFMKYWTARGPREWLDEVHSLAHQAMTIDPQDARALHLLGQYHLFRAEFHQAAAAYGAAVRLNPSLALAHVGLGAVSYLTGHREEALASYNTALRLSPFDSKSFHWLGELAFLEHLNGNFEPALTYAARSMQLRPGYFYAHLIWIASLARMQRLTEATAAVVAFRERFPKYSHDDVHWLTLIPEPMRRHLIQGVEMAGLSDTEGGVT